MLKILNMLKKGSIVSEQMKQKLEDVLTEIFISENNSIEEGTSGTHIAPPRSAMKSKDRAHLITLYKRIKNQIGSDSIAVKFMQNHIRVSISNEFAKSDFDFTPFMGSILEYMLDQKLNITPFAGD